MNKQSLPTIALLLLGLFNVGLAQGDQPDTTDSVGHLRCEYRENPIGVDRTNPLLSWWITSDQRGEKQEAYQILVASDSLILTQDKGDLWDSGKVASDNTIQIPYAGKPLKSLTTSYWKVRVWDKDGKPSQWSAPASWTMGKLKLEDWSAQWITPQDGASAPWLRREFNLAQAPESALVTVHSPDYFELYVNGTKAGGDVLTPAVSDLKKQTFTVTYDVQKLLRPGKNCLGLWLKSGWADRIAVRAQLDAVVAGKSEVVGTDTTWKIRPSGYSHIGGRKCNDYGGERIDAALNRLDWCKPGIDEAAWSPVVITTPPAGRVCAQPCPLNRIGAQIPAVAVTPLGEGRYEIDFGTNLTGWLRLGFPVMQSGQKVRLYFADRMGIEGEKVPTTVGFGKMGDLSISRFPNANSGTNSYQTYNQISEFVSAGQPGEVFQNKFNYAGFRYVVVEGLLTAPKKEDATALLIESDLEPTGSFECSDELLNRIHRLNQWTLRCLNLGGYMVDCPTRERMGYGGDGQTSLVGMMMNFNASTFYEKWAGDWRQAQAPTGALPNIAPWGGGGGGPPWPGIAAALPWKHYLHYGNRRILEDNFQTAKNYVEYLDSRATNKVLHAWGSGFAFLGDWVPPERGMDGSNWPNKQMAELVNNCYRVYLWQIIDNMALALGRTEEAAHAEQQMAAIRPAVHAAYFDTTQKRYVIDEEIYYALPLMTGVTPDAERAAVMANLEKCILVKNKGHLDTGLVGTIHLMDFLRDAGRNDLILTMYQQKTYPGWGYMVERGATTLWEQWNGYWSQIHACFASADNWLYQGLAGINPDPEKPGFSHIIIKPAIVGDLTWVEASYESVHGPIRCRWDRKGNELTLAVTIPPNTTATIRVPTSAPDQVQESGNPISKVEGIKVLQSPKSEPGSLLLEVGSGKYQFTAPI